MGARTVTLRVEKRFGTATVKMRVTASSIERALELCGEEAHIVFPIEPEVFFAPEGAAESVEKTPAKAAERRAEAA